MRTFWTCEGGNQRAVEKIQEWGGGEFHTFNTLSG